jgi:hypothetical protein
MLKLLIGGGNGYRHGKEGKDEEGLHGGFVFTRACEALMFVLKSMEYDHPSACLFIATMAWFIFIFA